MALAGETLPAVDAGVRQLARVSPIVQPQFPGGQKRLPAGGAKVIPFPAVHLHVSYKAIFAQVFLTDLAKVEGTVVHTFVLLESTTGEESLVALVARECSSFLVNLLVIIKAGPACESPLALSAVVAKVVQLHMRLQLIGMFKDFLARGTFNFFFREVFAHRSHTQKPFIDPGWLFPFSATLLFGAVLLLLLFQLFFDAAFLFASLLIVYAELLFLTFSL